MFFILGAVERHSPFLIFMLAFTMNRYTSQDTFFSAVVPAYFKAYKSKKFLSSILKLCA
jgi:hypothetical protein